LDLFKIKKIDLPSGESICFEPSIVKLIDEGRELYQDAFKKHIAEKEKEYYAYSTAQFLVYGRQRIDAAIQLVKQEFESLFTAYFIEKGRNYIAPYIETLLPTN
jgi:hypothetical protein